MQSMYSKVEYSVNIIANAFITVLGLPLVLYYNLLLNKSNFEDGCSVNHLQS